MIGGSIQSLGADHRSLSPGSKLDRLSTEEGILEHIRGELGTIKRPDLIGVVSHRQFLIYKEFIGFFAISRHLLVKGSVTMLTIHDMLIPMRPGLAHIVIGAQQLVLYSYRRSPSQPMRT